MARKKEISKQKILTTAYKLAIPDGIETLTARRIAQAVHCSTQPIYLEFSNMSDLRRQVLGKISEELSANTLQRQFTGEALVDLDLSYIYFAKEHVDLFKALFIDGKFGHQVVANLLMTLGRQKFIASYGIDHFDDARIDHIVLTNWISATGIAALFVNEVAAFDQTQMINILKAQIHDAILTDRFDASQQNPMFAGQGKSSLSNKLA